MKEYQKKASAASQVNHGNQVEDTKKSREQEISQQVLECQSIGSITVEDGKGTLCRTKLVQCPGPPMLARQKQQNTSNAHTNLQPR